MNDTQIEWENLRKKTIDEINSHRKGGDIGIKLTKSITLSSSTGYGKVHMSEGGHNLCGHGWVGAVAITKDAKRVTCYYCLKRIKYPRVISS